MVLRLCLLRPSSDVSSPSVFQCADDGIIRKDGFQHSTLPGTGRVGRILCIMARYSPTPLQRVAHNIRLGTSHNFPHSCPSKAHNIFRRGVHTRNLDLSLSPRRNTPCADASTAVRYNHHGGGRNVQRSWSDIECMMTMMNIVICFQGL